MREKILKTLAHWHTAHPWRMTLVVILLTILFAAFARRLAVTTRTSDLLPEKDPKVAQFNKIIEEFSTATSIVVVIQGEERRIKEFADQLAPRILEARDTGKNDSLQEKIDKLQRKIDKLGKKERSEAKIAKLESTIRELRSQMNYKLFQRVDYKAPIEFLKEHMLMLVIEEDLTNLKDIFMGPNLVDLIPNINNSMEKEYVGQEESISTREKEDGAWGFLDGIQNLILLLQKASEGEEVPDEDVRAAADKILFGEPYLLSYDKTALLLNVIPAFTLMDRDYIMSGTRTAQSILDDLLKDFPDIEAGLSGSIPKEHDEQVYAQQSLGYTTVIAMLAILILLMVSFRMWVAPVFAIANLLVGVIWALGSAFIVVGQLNLVTSTMAVIILGLGIDFSIHLISGFTEHRAAGESIAQAMEAAFMKSGKGIVTGAVTTSCAFYALAISQSRGMKEMGLVMGTGLLAILLATFLVLPVLLVLRARLRDKRLQKKGVTKLERDISFRVLGRACDWLGRHYVFTIITSLVISVFLIWAAFQIRWDYDFRNMEPKGLVSVELIDTVVEKFDLSMDYALVTTDNVQDSYELAKEYRELGSVAITDDISVFVPSPEQQQERIPHIDEIRGKIQSATVNHAFLPDELETFKNEIERLEMNIMEMQDMAFIGGQDKVDNKCKEIVGDPENPDSPNIIRKLLQLLDGDASEVRQGLSTFQKSFAPHFKQSIIRMSSIEPIHLEELPTSILDRYSNKARNQFLLSVYPAGSIYDGEFLKRFVNDVESVSERATGVPPLSIALLRIFGRDGRNAIILTLIVVFLLLWADFSSPKRSLIAMIPLAFGVFWMVGLMYLVGIKLSLMSVMGLPLIIGIGIDDGVHIMHRWRHEGNGRLRIVFASTGKAILLTSLTTMLAFGSLIFSAFPAWGQFGGALFLGVGGCFITTVVILPGILGWIGRRSNRKKD